jgi:dihydropteroate synthase
MQRRCQVWAVLNVTPDSFSDGGHAFEHEAAFVRAKQLLAAGADVIDVGGVSSRPPGRAYGAGAEFVSLDEELRRVVPVVEQIVHELGARVSVDTVRPEVASAALRAGASIVNDISTGASDALMRVVADADAELVLMHNRGDGSASGKNAQYERVVDDVLAELSAAAVRASVNGVRFDRIWLDPGVGFAKTAADSLAVMAALPRFVRSGYRILVGPSRKSFIAAIEASADAPLGSLVQRAPGGSTPADRIGGTAASVAFSVLAGAHAVRVHDVPVMCQTVLVTEALMHARAAREPAS